MNVEIKKYFLRAIGAAGLATFVGFFLLTFSVPGWVESFAFNFIEQRVKAQISSQIDGFELSGGSSGLSQIAGRLYQQNQEQVTILKSILKEKSAGIVDIAITQVRDLACECRRQDASLLDRAIEFGIGSISVIDKRLISLAQNTYLRIASELTREIRIFTGSNSMVFLIIFLSSFLGQDAVRQAFWPFVILTLTTVSCIYLYVFDQNWLLTLIHSDYVGFTYIAYLAILFAVLCDIAFNSGRALVALIALTGWSMSKSPSTITNDDIR